VADREGAGPLPSKQLAAPKPTKSITLASAVGQLPDIAVAALDSSTLPEAVAMLIVLLDWSKERIVPTVLPDCRPTSQY
jgi:hypothetical protein